MERAHKVQGVQQPAEVSNLYKGHENTSSTMTRRVSKRIQAQQSTESYRKLQRKHSTLPIHNTANSDIRIQQDLVSEKDASNFSPDENSGFFQCGTCSKNFLSSDSLSSHIMITHNSRIIFQCHLCSVAFATADLLSSHLAKEHQDVLKPFKCGLCEEGFFENAALLKHLDENHEKLPPFYKCNVCLIPFKEISVLITHAIQRHPPSNQYRCALCGSLFSQGDKLMTHLVQKHTKETSKLLSPECVSPAVSCTADKLIKSRKFPNTNHLPASNTLKQVEPKSNLEQGKPIAKKKYINSKIIPSPINIRSEVQVKKTSSKENKGKVAESEKANTEWEETDDQTEISGKNVEGEDFKIIQRKEQVIPKRKHGEEKGTKMKPIIKDKDKLVITFMKRDPDNNAAVYDCDVCGQRLQEESSFIEHRDNHFFDGKFCINCVHCSQVFNSFENLHSHVGRDKCCGYKCQDCGKLFALEPAFLTHKVKEHGDMKKANRVLICKTCEKTFENRTAFVRHASSHSEDKCIECKLCKHAFTTPETLFGHLRTRHFLIPSTRQQYKFICEMCGTKFVKKEGLTNHKALVHKVHENSNLPSMNVEDPQKEKKNLRKSVKRTGHWRSAEDDKKRRTCHICHRVFRRFKDVRRHVGTHTKPYLCSHCGKSFPYRYSLDAHIKAYHSADNPHKCDTCNKSFSGQRSLLIHSRIHTGEKPHQCPICLKHFRQLANLSLHIKLHNSEKPIKCQLCDYRCSHQGYLKRHMSTHSKEKKHHCPICNKGFTEKANLSNHVKRHSKVKNHVCAVCGHGFGQRYYLNNHMRVHTKEKPYICPVCNRTFTMRPNMVAHIKRTHPSYNYQPIKRSHQSIADSSNNSNQNINTSNDMNLNLPIESHNFISSVAAVGRAMPSSNNTLSVISPPTYPLQVPSSQPLPVPQPGQTSHPPVGSSSIPSYQLPVSEQQRNKLESVPSFPHGATDLMTHLTPLHQQREPQISSMSDVANQHLGQDHTLMNDQTMRQELERQQNYILNISDRFVPPQFDTQREILGPNFASAPLSNQEYNPNVNMYTYPTLPPETSFLHGFFPSLNQQNPQTESKQ